MKKLSLYFILTTIITACSIIKPAKTVNTKYYLLSYSNIDKICKTNRNINIEILPTKANSPYDTYNMYYSTTPYTLGQYAYSAWATLPEEAINHAIEQSINNSCLFNVVTTNTNVISKYQLRSQLIELKENIKNNHSIATLIIKIQVINKNTNSIIRNKIFIQNNSIATSPEGMTIGTINNLQAFLTKLNNWLESIKE